MNLIAFLPSLHLLWRVESEISSPLPGMLDNILGIMCYCCSVAQWCLTLCDPMACNNQASLSFTIPQSLLKLVSIELVIPSNHLALLLLSSPAFNLSQHQGLFSWVSSLHQVAKLLELQLQHQSFQWIFRLISFRVNWFDLLAVQGTLKSLLQHHSSKASILQCSAFFMAQLSHPFMTTGKP